MLNASQKQIIRSIEQTLKASFLTETTGHDWWHIDRVHKNAVHIATQIGEPIEMFVVELGALLHDIADWKFHGGDLQAGPRQARKILIELHVQEDIIKQVEHIVESVSFKGAHVENPMKSLEGMVVQDADRLDALGAIGIARAFAYGGQQSRMIYDPDETCSLHASFEEYKQSQSSSIGHFYEKILLLKDMMNTVPGKEMAQRRHDFVEQFLTEFHQEWDSER